MTISIARTAAAPAAGLWLTNSAGQLVDLSTGYTFVVKLGAAAQTALLTKTTGVTGAVGAGVSPSGTPNLTIAWTANELAAIPVGVYQLDVTATQAGLARIWTTSIRLYDAVA
jgi:hypothetical protein